MNKDDISKGFRTLLEAILAGFCIGIGGLIFLSLESKIIGSIMFSIGLLTILIFRFNLFTGKVGYIKDNKPSYLIDLLLIWLGNFIGTFTVAKVFSLTRSYEKLKTVADTMVEVKMNDTFLSLFCLGVFCGLLMFIAVDTYKQMETKQQVAAVLMPIFCVSVFILSGFEHSIADMFYFSFAGQAFNALPQILIISLGNALGGNLIPIFRLKKTN